MLFIALTNGATNNYANTRPFDPTDPSKIQKEKEDAAASEQNANNIIKDDVSNSQGIKADGAGGSIEQEIMDEMGFI